MIVGILGGGESGIAAALLAKNCGDDPFVSDIHRIREDFKEQLQNNEIRFEENGHSFDILIRSSLIVKSPGIPPDVHIVQELVDAGAEIVSEMEYAFREAKAPVIGITGSNGKTTTTNLVHHLLESGGIVVSKGGNLGRAFARLIVEEDVPEYYVLEVSSFQLDDIKTFKPAIAAILNITPDHLDRYKGKLSLYASSKCRIAMNQNAGDVLLINADDAVTKQALKGLSPACKIREVDRSLWELFRTKVDNSFLRGAHNASNASFAIAIARICGLRDAVIEDALNSFKNDAHRMQVVGIINGVEWINDSKATNVDAVHFALSAIDKPIVWMAGGEDKGNQYEDLYNDVGRVKALITVGKDSEKMKKAFQARIELIKETEDIEEAVRWAAELSEEGDCVLLSPACASFDLFKNYKDRGNQFVEAVWDLLR